MTRPPKRTVPRPIAMFLPPVAALLLAAVYTTWQARDAAAAAATLCAQFKAGDALDNFVRAALDAEFEVQDNGPGSLSMIAAKEVFRLDRESYRCTAHHDGSKIRAMEATMVKLEK